jgi:hypothetical protein
MLGDMVGYPSEAYVTYLLEDLLGLNAVCDQPHQKAVWKPPLVLEALVARDCIY